MTPWWLAALPAVSALGLTAFNLAVWPTGRTLPPPSGVRASVLIPARNEERAIEACVRAALAQGDVVAEVVVCDDHSTDATAAVVQALAAEDPRVRLVQGRPLPEGWVGKVWACATLAAHARGDLWIFVDADVRLQPGGVSRLLALRHRHEARLITAYPRQDMPSAAEGWIMPLLSVTYTSWLPLPLIWRTHDPRFLAANGQVMCFDRDLHDAVGGFAALRSEVVDDMALGRLAKRARLRVLFADARHIATCRMYDSWPAIVRGFSKNLYEGIGATPLALLVVVLLYGGTFLLPWLLLPLAALGVPQAVAPALVGVGAGYALRGLLCLAHGHPWWSVPLHPTAVVGLLGIAVNSWRWSARGAIAWAGRTYPGRRGRTAGAAP